MSTPKRILFVASAVTPFSDDEATAGLAHSVARHVHESSNFDARIMTPRYGTISARTHSLHEVIRLSGTEVPMGEDAPAITMEVSSLPETRLQVYFIGNDAYFGRKGLAAENGGAPYEDNAERALFFCRSVLATVKKLRWGPDVIHAFGWAGGLMPLLLRAEHAGDELFAQTRMLYTPDATEPEAELSAELAERLHLEASGESLDRPLREVGAAWAGTVLYPPAMDAPADAEQLSADEEERAAQVDALYEQALSEEVVA